MTSSPTFLKLARLQARILSGDPPTQDELIAAINERTREIAEAKAAGLVIRPRATAKPRANDAKPKTATKEAREKAKAGLDSLLGNLLP